MFPVTSNSPIELPSPSFSPDTPPGNLTEQERWFCMTEYNGNKVPVAPWIDENPDGEKTAWDQPVGHNWPGVKTDYDTAKEWAEHIDDWFLATRIGDYEKKETERLHLLDFDDVRDPETEEIHPEVEALIDSLDSYAQVSYSGTGVHVYIVGHVPEDYKITGFTAELPDWEHSDKLGATPEVEGYSRSRFIAITEKHIEGTPTEVKDRPDVLEKVYEQYGEEDDEDGVPEDFDGVYDREPDHSKGEVETTETTGDWDIIFDAIAHAEPRCAGGQVRLKSSVTNERSSGIIDLDPSWEQSDSGTRLGYDDGFIYRKGSVGLDILQVVALEEHIITSPNQYPTGEDFSETVDELRRRGAHIPEYDPDEAPDPLATLPLARLDALDQQERVRYAKRRGIEWPDVEEVRERLDDEIVNSVDQQEVAVKSSPTGSGKTYTVSTKRWKSMPGVTDDQPVIHAHRTHEARDQAREMSEKAGVDAFTLKGRTELCDVAAGLHDPDNEAGNESYTIDGVPISEWMDHRAQRQGIPFSVVHRWAEQEVERDLPCQRGDTECAALTQFDNIPRDDDGNPTHDVVHATHQFLQVPGLRMHTNIFIDEKPAFGIDLSSEEVRESVNAYLDYIDTPVKNYSELVKASETGRPPGVGEGQGAEGLTDRELKKSFAEGMDVALSGDNTYIDCPVCDGTGERTEEGVENYDITSEPDEKKAAPNDCPECGGSGSIVAHRGTPSLDWYKNNPKAHALAPAFARSIWEAEEVADGRKHATVHYHPPRFDHDAHDSAAWNRVQVDVVLNEQWEVVQAEAVPDFSLANAVIGLDAHPQQNDPYWMAAVDKEIDTDYTLTEEERALYRRYERGLGTVQVGDGIQPVTTGEWLDQGQGKKFKAIIKHLRQYYGEDFDSAITSLAAKGHIREAMQEAGIGEPEMMHYGNEESRNDFAGKDVGLVVGSIDPGDHRVVNLLARLDMDAEPAHKGCPVCDGTGHLENEMGDPEVCGTCGGEGEVRERGRGFVGEDADVADNVLKGVREHHVAQSAGRWARDADDPEDTATVFIVSEAAPRGFIDAKAPGVTWTTNEAQRRRLEYVRDQADGATAKEVSEEFDCSKQAAWRTLKTAAEKDILEKTPGAGPYGADVYSPSDGFVPDGAADLDPTADGRTSTTSYEDYNTYSITIESLPHCSYSRFDDEKGEWEYQSTFEWYERALAPPS